MSANDYYGDMKKEWEEHCRRHHTQEEFNTTMGICVGLAGALAVVGILNGVFDMSLWVTGIIIATLAAGYLFKSIRVLNGNEVPGE